VYYEKFDNQEYFSTQEFHNDREAADHWNEPGHRPRMELTVSWANEILRDDPEYTVIDYGSGSGGVISAIETERKIGYDFCPDNVKFAQDRGRNVIFKDFVADDNEYSDIAIITECLEHLADPLEFLRTLRARYLIMSMPVGETNEHHYEFHTHGADEDGVKYLMLYKTEWKPLKHQNLWGTQIWLAEKMDEYDG